NAVRKALPQEVPAKEGDIGSPERVTEIAALDPDGMHARRQGIDEDPKSDEVRATPIGQRLGGSRLRHIVRTQFNRLGINLDGDVPASELGRIEDVVLGLTQSSRKVPDDGRGVVGIEYRNVEHGSGLYREGVAETGGGIISKRQTAEGCEGCTVGK